MKEGQEEKRTRTTSFPICPFLCPCDWALVFFLLLRQLVPLGSLGDIFSAMEGRRKRRRACGVSFTITWKFPARSRILWTPYSAPALIPAVQQEQRSVTEHINVYCFVSWLDRPTVTTEAVIPTKTPCRCVNSINKEWNGDCMVACSSCRGQKHGRLSWSTWGWMEIKK